MKMRIENELLTADGKERNIKLGYGGIREIEFFTQAMQLVNGGYEPAIREPNTLRALAQLAQYKFIPARDRAKLSDAYRFLRQVEHKVQIVQEAHAHSIPEGEDEERALARRLGYARTTKRNERELFGKTIAVIPLPYETFLTASSTAHKKISLRKERQRSGRFGAILTGKRSLSEGLRESALRIRTKPMRTFSKCGMARSMPLPAQSGSK